MRSPPMSSLPSTQPTQSLRLSAPAKLNLTLRILGRRADGYHELETVFQLLDFGDQLTFHTRADNTIAVHCPDLDIPPEQNLVYRAADLLRHSVGKNAGKEAVGADINLQKNLPAGGGIGGGSSDAATTLLALNHLWRCNLDLEQLAGLGRQLGADIPVFVHGHSAWAEGVGERLTPIAVEPMWYLVLTPDCHVSTGELFSHPRLTRDSAAITLAALRDRRLTKQWLAQYAGNDFQPLVEALYPEVRNARAWLAQFGAAQLTGSGACVFAAFDSEEAAQNVLKKRPEGLEGFVAAGIDQSPAHEQLAKFAAIV
ncbi:4-(cytidine 5'-diphospho)-2-C-methyl-D-erythritol kinase [Microbulbifer sp.]|uniref:4-(cytidine 5'-diphospho)-2-C-methyl-D-erythritol kinase n=1 Tax=Microbulbifer sp. TaxID=1908541 RepID=UPI002586513F|nr:4-(cytidine 5'-diphospho)-2-C-methyl-D-erythritol kinase [Microbulbifer sp.]